MKNIEVINYFLKSTDKERKCDGLNLYVRGDSLFSYNGQYKLAKICKEDKRNIILINTSQIYQGKATKKHKDMLLKSLPKDIEISHKLI
jgi:hypothetical protein